MAENLGKLALRLRDNAQRFSSDFIVDTFVDVKPLIDLLLTEDHQVIFGRRGTGKTHALRYAAEWIDRQPDAAAIYLDMKRVGANDIVGNSRVPLDEQASRLLVDVLGALHSGLLALVVDHDVADGSPESDLRLAILEDLARVITDLRVEGDVETSLEGSVEKEGSREAKRSASLGWPLALHLGSETRDGVSAKEGRRHVVSYRGQPRVFVSFGAVTDRIEALIARTELRRLWILIDEWNEVPVPLQPLLADLLKRSLFSIPSVTVKIGAVGGRAYLVAEREDGSQLGIEVGSDTTTALDLDQFLVFGHDNSRARAFFATLFFQHLRFLAKGDFAIAEPSDLVESLFASPAIFEELVRASGSVPRDAIHILRSSIAASGEGPLSLRAVTAGIRTAFRSDKYRSMQGNRPGSLLRYIYEQYLRASRTRMFLLAEADASDKLVRYLHDRRLVHLIDHGIAPTREAQLHDVFAVDYGAYLELLNPSISGIPALSELHRIPPDPTSWRALPIVELNRFYDSDAGRTDFHLRTDRSWIDQG
jgi:hypothetical protein